MKRIAIADTTLLESRKTGGLVLSFKEKIEIAKLLDKLKVDCIELPPITNTKEDILAHTICSVVKNSTVCCHAGLEAASIDAAAAGIKTAKNAQIQITVPISPVQMEYICHKKPPVVLQKIGEAVAYAKTKCASVSFCADDATRSEESFLYAAVTAAIEAGATTVTIGDTAGVMLPYEYEGLMNKLYAQVPALKTVALAVCCSNELRLAAAATFSAVSAGATQIKTTIFGDSAAGLEEIADIFKTRGDSLGICFDVSTTELGRSIQQTNWIFGTKRGESGIQDKPDAENEKIKLTVNDDSAAVAKAVTKLGYDLSDEDNAKVYEAFCRVAAKKEVTVAELDAIVASAAMQVPPTYKVKSYVINSGNIITATANIELEKDSHVLQGVSVGDGPVDAAVKAIEQIIGHHYELDDFQIKAVTEGREAVGSTLVKLRSNGKLYSGSGISTDIVGAAIRAYINALNKIVFEESNQ